MSSRTIRESRGVTKKGGLPLFGVYVPRWLAAGPDEGVPRGNVILDPKTGSQAG